jgi:hypothetical protein
MPADTFEGKVWKLLKVYDNGSEHGENGSGCRMLGHGKHGSVFDRSNY